MKRRMRKEMQQRVQKTMGEKMQKGMVYSLTAAFLAGMLSGCGAKSTDWLGTQGITVTPQGENQVEICGYDQSSGEITGDFTADVKTAITETTDGAPEGFKKVTARFDIDVSNSTGDGFIFWCSAFDRYTGTSFEFDSAVNYEVEGEHTAQDGFVTIQDGDQYYDVSIEFFTDNQDYTVYKTITVTCPEDYDGVVFQLGNDSLEQMQKNSEIDYTARLYTIDELPYYGEGYLYFTLADK